MPSIGKQPSLWVLHCVHSFCQSCVFYVGSCFFRCVYSIPFAIESCCSYFATVTRFPTLPIEYNQWPNQWKPQFAVYYYYHCHYHARLEAWETWGLGHVKSWAHHLLLLHYSIPTNPRHSNQSVRHTTKHFYYYSPLCTLYTLATRGSSCPHSPLKTGNSCSQSFVSGNSWLALAVGKYKVRLLFTTKLFCINHWFRFVLWFVLTCKYIALELKISQCIWKGLDA